MVRSSVETKLPIWQWQLQWIAQLMLSRLLWYNEGKLSSVENSALEQHYVLHVRPLIRCRDEASIHNCTVCSADIFTMIGWSHFCFCVAWNFIAISNKCDNNLNTGNYPPYLVWGWNLCEKISSLSSIRVGATIVQLSRWTLSLKRSLQSWKLRWLSLRLIWLCMRNKLAVSFQFLSRCCESDWNNIISIPHIYRHSPKGKKKRDCQSHWAYIIVVLC